MGTPGEWMERLSWPEVEAWLARDPVVLVPIGAAAKEHGHHLPLMTDYLTARELASRTAAVLPVLIAPVISFGYYPAFVRYPGSQHLSAATFMALVKEVLAKLIADGARRVVIVNTGVSTEGPVEIVARDLLAQTGVRVASAHIRNLGKSGGPVLAQRFGGHGDEAETSTVLAIAPELVRMDQAVEDYGNLAEQPRTAFVQPTIFDGDPGAGLDYSASGVRGDSTLASREKGEALLEAMVADLVDGIRKLHPRACAGERP